MKLTARSLLLDSFSRKPHETDREKPFYWTVLTEKCMIMSARAILLDSFDRKMHDNVHESDSIGQF